MCNFTQLLWYENNGYLVFYRYDKKGSWNEWKTEQGYDQAAMYRFIAIDTLEEGHCE